MRIIAGKYKGRVIRFPNSKYVRPTTDKVKESLFNYLTNRINFDGIKVCDVYAGSGSLGLEALSRGAGEIHFVEKNLFVIKVLKENIYSLNEMDNCKIYKTEAVRFSLMKNHEEYNLILADPPFFKDDIHIVVQNLIKRNYLTKEGILVVERSIKTKDADVENFHCEPFKKIGDSLLYLFENN